MAKKKWELKAGEKNLVSKVTGIIKELLSMKRGARFFDSFDATFDFFQERVSIAPEHWKRNSDGEVKWRQAIRNAAKPKTKNRKPDALTQGELMALVDGGFALPNSVPKHLDVIEFPDRGGFKVKEVKPKRPVPKRKLERENDPMPPHIRADKAAKSIRQIVRELDEDIREGVVMNIRDGIEEGNWYFESRAQIARRRSPRVTDEE